MTNSKKLQMLLSSGLPLEGEVATMLHKMDFGVMGEYSYLRLGPDRTVSEHSVDIHARRFMTSDASGHWADFNLLVECKYQRPGVEWVFVRRHRTGHTYGGAATLHEDLCPRRARNHWTAVRQLSAVDSKAHRCMKGIVLHGSDADKHAIKHGASQLRYALPKLLARTFHHQAFGFADDHVQAAVLCPILVTTAPLYVLKPGATVRRIQEAKTLEDVATSRPFVRLAEASGPDLEQYTEDVLDEAFQSPRIVDRLAQARDILSQAGWCTAAPGEDLVRMRVRNATEVVLVVQLRHFRRLVHAYLSALDDIGKDLVQYATLLSDQPDAAPHMRPKDVDLLDVSLPE